ncbi:hypothetical protein [Asanoa siamensis]|uniref:DUF1963 domain-containing protein n=1 Tax=Asanoa siamensis TaxID=926357 RepID=A0ABQ4CQR7_9ACTN|nr:hypothetical protein [Asanoa siamensis]GIF73358.1 hypothetical protein Asi02nite_28760 [Asanoa siamensis]
MTRTTPPRPVDIAALFPELRDHTTTATRLHPRPGRPTVADSSVGGPLLWPADEPWPVCHAADHATFDLGTPIPSAARDLMRQPIPYVPVAQLYRRDVPDFAGPDGADLLQLLWCPLPHEDEDYNPRVGLYWRSSPDVTTTLDSVPEPPVAHDEYLPVPCVVHPEQVREYQYGGLLPDDLDARITAWDDDDRYDFELSLAPGWKVGGFANWSLSDPEPMDCADCGTAMTLLLTVDCGEWSTEGESWRPIEDPPGTSANPADVVIGRGYALQIFRCPASFDHPPATAMQ